MFLSYQPQNWSLPDSIIYYITQKPSSSKGYQKMIQSCKYFFAKNPIIVLSKLSFYHYNRDWEAKSDNEHIFPFIWRGKLWISDYLTVAPNSFTPNLASLIIPKIYQSDIKKIQLCDQIISFKNFLFLVSNVIKISLNRVIVKGRDGTALPIEKVVEALPKIKEIDVLIADTSVPIEAMKEFLADIRKTVSSKTMKELLKIEHFKKIDNFILYGVSETFDIETFYSYMKTNNQTKFTLVFNQIISQAKNDRIEAIVDEIIATKNHEYKPPCISFRGLDIEKFAKIEAIFRQS